MASWEELQHFIANGSRTARLREDAELEHLHRATTRTRKWDELVVLAFDHRAQLEEIAARHGRGAGDIKRLKRLIAQGARRGANGRPGAGIILDGRFGEDVLPSLTGQGWWVARPVEQPGSRPLAFDAGCELALEMRGWPAEHVAKCLVCYHPQDDEPLRAVQLAALAQLQAASIGTGHEFLIEVIPPRDMNCGETTLADALTQIYQAGVRPDWWKLPPADSDIEWAHIERTIAQHDPHCRGVLVLGMEASEEDLDRSFRLAAPHAVCRGFAVGRSIFADAATAWFAGSMGDEQVVADIAARYSRLITSWDEARAGMAEPVNAIS
jgi:5-dehydro-2-deoxygluconokinase